MVRFWKSINWLLSFTVFFSLWSLLFIILLNAAGTKIYHSTSPHKYNATLLANFRVLTVSPMDKYLCLLMLTQFQVHSFYRYADSVESDRDEPRVPDWIFHFYLNAACTTPQACLTGPGTCNHTAFIPPDYFPPAETAAIWPICFYTKVGRRIDVSAILNTMDRYLYGNDSVFPLASTYYGYLPPANVSEVAGDPFLPNVTIPTIEPFILWVLSAISSFIFLVLVGVSHAPSRLLKPGLIDWLGISPTAVLIDFLLVLFSFLANFVAMGLLNKNANGYSRMFDDTKTEDTNFVGVGSAFVGMGWMSVSTGGIASILAYVRWRNRRSSRSGQANEMRRLQREADERPVFDPPPPYEPQRDGSNLADRD
jgi:hypothetical protein